MTLIHYGDQTMAIPTEPQQCGRCLAMSGVFVNRFGFTSCVRCYCTERSQHEFTQREKGA